MLFEIHTTFNDDATVTVSLVTNYDDVSFDTTFNNDADNDVAHDRLETAINLVVADFVEFSRNERA